MKKQALCIGINDYPGTGSDLSGCVNDATDWTEELSARGFEVKTMLDNEATKSSMVDAFKNIISDAKSGDSVVITYSGHGTFVPDTSGDESDNQDEGLCPYDIHEGNVLIDDEINQLFQARSKGVKIVLISDSCHSGSVTRMAKPDPDSDGPRARFLHPSQWMNDSRNQRSFSSIMNAIQTSWGIHTPWISALSIVGGDLLLAGCRDYEYSYDTSFNGKANGAFTYYALKTLKQLPDDATYSDWYSTIRNYLPSISYSQTPQILGSKQARGFKILT